MKVLYLGADIFAVPILQSLTQSDAIKIIAVVTRPAKPAGRGLRPQPNPVLRQAKELNIRTIIINSSKSWKEIKSLITTDKPDYVLVAALGVIIPDDVLNLLPNKFINVHPSLLPKYRGPAPIETSILSDDKETGVSFIILTNRLDAGPIIKQYKTSINKLNTSTLSEKISRLAAQKLPQLLHDLSGGKIKPINQNEDQATYTHIITKADGRVSLNDDPADIAQKIKAYHPWPGVTVKLKDKEFKLIDAFEKNDILYIKTIQPSGKKPISARDFYNGYKNLLTSFPKSVKLYIAGKFNEKKG